MRSVGSYFLEKVWKWKSVFGLRRRGRIAYAPIPWSTQGDPKIEEKKEHISEALFLSKKYKKYEKLAPKGLQKGEFISGVAPLGAPLEPQADFWCKKWAHSAPKVPLGTQTCFKNDPKRAKHDPKSDSESVFIGDSYTGPQISTEARRTARSAYNAVLELKQKKSWRRSSTKSIVWTRRRFPLDVKDDFSTKNC